jgi:hypothetical protein
MFAMSDELIADTVHAAVRESSARYIATRRERIKPFTKKHFSFRGSARLNRRALGMDLLRTPANAVWAIPYLLSRSGAAVVRQLGFRRTANCFGKVPPGFKTDVEREVEWLLYSEFLEIPFEQGERRCTRDALFEEILNHPAIVGLLLPELVRLDELLQRQRLKEKLEEHLRTYTASRTAAADLSGSLLSLAAGAAAFSKLTPGSVAMGSTAAAALAQQLAVANFALGPTLGSLYYGVFPATVSAGLLAATTGGLMLAVGVLAALAGIVTDPVQQALGLHERKLAKLVDALEAALQGEAGGELKLHDAYVARVFDLWDLLQAATRVLH